MNEGLSRRRGVLTAAGHSVHRVRVATRGAEQEPKPDEVPIDERYMLAAAFVHNTSCVPRGDRFIVVCTCGKLALLSPPGAFAKASLMAQEHVINEADKLQNKLEPQPLESGVA